MGERRVQRQYVVTVSVCKRQITVGSESADTQLVEYRV